MSAAIIVSVISLTIIFFIIIVIIIQFSLIKKDYNSKITDIGSQLTDNLSSEKIVDKNLQDKITKIQQDNLIHVKMNADNSVNLNSTVMDEAVVSKNLLIKGDTTTKGSIDANSLTLAGQGVATQAWANASSKPQWSNVQGKPNVVGSGNDLSTTGNLTVNGQIQTNTLQLGKKYKLSANGDGQGYNDGWLRLLGTGDNGATNQYYGGMAVGQLWNQGDAYLGAGTTTMTNATVGGQLTLTGGAAAINKAGGAGWWNNITHANDLVIFNAQTNLNGGNQNTNGITLAPWNSAGGMRVHGGGADVKGSLKLRYDNWGDWTDNAALISWTPDSSKAGPSFGGPNNWSHFPWFDGNTYIRAGNTGGSVIIGDYGNMNVNVGNGGGIVNVNGPAALNDNRLRIRSGGDDNHALQYTSAVDGPRLWGCGGGQLGTHCGGDKTALQWDNNANVTIPNGSLCIGSTCINEAQLKTLLVAPFTFTFTTCGVKGSAGPTLAQMKASYMSTPWTQNTANLNMTSQGIQLWTVPTTGNYKIMVSGATGGSVHGYFGGGGRMISAVFYLTAGQVLQIVVGQVGGTSSLLNTYNTNALQSSGCGGGGSFVAINGSPILVAGGGGGAVNSASTNWPYAGNGGDASAYNVTSGGVGPAGSSGTGGTNGAGGTNSGSGWSSGGGGGFTGNGCVCQQGQTQGGNSFTNNPTGGVSGYWGGSYYNYATGGYGGGGGATMHYTFVMNGGGGGGYSGGGAGINTWGSGGGGGNYVSGSSIADLGLNRNGDGSVMITSV